MNKILSRFSQKFSPKKRLLLVALLGDVTLLLFLTVLGFSALEILLPGIVLSRFPLAILMMLLVCSFLFFVILTPKIPEEKNIPKNGSRVLWSILLIGTLGVLLLSARGFGVVGASVLVLLLAFLFILARRSR
jgi:lysylphosphatidylglycerol synthetase-like protein (DUF2156 family)